MISSAGHEFWSRSALGRPIKPATRVTLDDRWDQTVAIRLRGDRRLLLGATQTLDCLVPNPERFRQSISKISPSASNVFWAGGGSAFLQRRSYSQLSKRRSRKPPPY